MITAEQLDKLFNSSSNKVDDNELKVLLKKAGGASDADYVGDDPEIEKMLNSGSGQSFADKTKTHKKKIKDKEAAVDTGNIEDFNLVIEDDEEECLSDFSNNMEEKKKNIGSRVPFDFDDLDEDLDDKESSSGRFIKKKELDSELDSESDAELDADLEPEQNIDLEQDDEEDYACVEEDNAIKSQLMKVCQNEEYLNDPLYRVFYREKLRAFNFLEKNIPPINFKKLEKELQMMHVKVDENHIMSLDEFNLKIQQIQSLRNRISKIRSIAIRDYILRKRVIKLLEECLLKQSSEKSSDKRMGEIQLHMADMEYRFAMSEMFFKDIEQIVENIACAHEALSRQITCLQERNREISRGSEPYAESKHEDKWDAVTSKEKKYG